MVFCAWRHECNEANGRKLITAHLKILFEWGPFLSSLAAKTGPPAPSSNKITRGVPNRSRNHFGGGTDFGESDLTDLYPEAIYRFKLTATTEPGNSGRGKHFNSDN